MPEAPRSSGIFAYSPWDAVPALAGVAHLLYLLLLAAIFPVAPWWLLLVMGLIYAISISWNINGISHNFLHNPFFVKSAGGRYYDVAEEMGLGESHVSRGIAIADVDGDGRLDYAVANQWEPSLFFHNASPRTGAFLGLRLRLPPDRPAIGAAATVFLPGGRKMSAQVDGGNGHSGKRSQDIHFGLGGVPADTPLRVEMRWRDAAGVHQRAAQLTPGWHTVMLVAQTGAVN